MLVVDIGSRSSFGHDDISCSTLCLLMFEELGDGPLQTYSCDEVEDSDRESMCRNQQGRINATEALRVCLRRRTERADSSRQLRHQLGPSM